VVGGRMAGTWSRGIGSWSSLGEGKEAVGRSDLSARRGRRRGSIPVGGGFALGVAERGR
jgi:hypothetical protein